MISIQFAQQMAKYNLYTYHIPVATNNRTQLVLFAVVMRWDYVPDESSAFLYCHDDAYSQKQNWWYWTGKHCSEFMKNNERSFLVTNYLI